MNVSYDFSDKAIVVTGGSSGIGKAIALAFDRAGAKVAVAGRNLENARAVVQTFKNEGLAVAMDVKDRHSVETGMAEIIGTFGGIDVLVANAGISNMNHALEITDEDWDQTFDVNARGVFLTNQVACRHFIASGRKGAVINVASLASKIGQPLLAHYSASKFAVMGWTQSLARELGPQGIRVNAVCPGFVRTPMQDREVRWEAELCGSTPAQVLVDYIRQTPLGRLEEADDVAGLTLFLASDAACFITGQAVNTTGGVRMD